MTSCPKKNITIFLTSIVMRSFWVSANGIFTPPDLLTENGQKFPWKFHGLTIVLECFRMFNSVFITSKPKQRYRLPIKLLWEPSVSKPGCFISKQSILTKKVWLRSLPKPFQQLRIKLRFDRLYLETKGEITNMAVSMITCLARDWTETYWQVPGFALLNWWLEVQDVPQWRWVNGRIFFAKIHIWPRRSLTFACVVFTELVWTCLKSLYDGKKQSLRTWQLGSSSQGPEQRIKSDATIWPSLPTWQKSHKISHVSAMKHIPASWKFWMVKSKHRTGRMSPLCAHLKRGSASPWRDMVTWTICKMFKSQGHFSHAAPYSLHHPAWLHQSLALVHFSVFQEVPWVNAAGSSHKTTKNCSKFRWSWTLMQPRCQKHTHC